MAVTIRMKRMGRRNREFYRICAADRRSPRDGRVIEEIGTYDPKVPETDARCTLDGERVKYWLSVGAKPSDAVAVLIKKYGPAGTHLKQMEAARAKLSMPRVVPEAGEPAFVPETRQSDTQPVAAAEAAAGEAAATEAAVGASAGEAAVGASAGEAAAGEAAAGESPAESAEAKAE